MAFTATDVSGWLPHAASSAIFTHQREGILPMLRP